VSTPRLLMLPISDSRGASTRYRVLQHVEHLEAAGFATRVRYPLGLGRGGAGRVVCRVADMLRDVYATGDASLLFVQRKTYVPGLAGRLRRQGRPVVFDMDDALDLPPPSATASPANVRRYRANFEATVRVADRVLCGNRFLASRLPHERYEILPTPIDTERFAPGAVAPGNGRTAGWVGYSDNLPYLEALAEPLREIARRHPGFRVVVVADRPAVLPGVPTEFRRWRLEDEVRCFGGIDVGLMPLEDSPWARGKCAFKAIQYMALGIPAIASPVGMNVEVIRDGENGLLAAAPGSWVEALDGVLRDRERGASLGAAGRRTIERDYALSVVSKRLVEILGGLLERSGGPQTTSSSRRA